MSDRGLPQSYRHLDGFGSHTYSFINQTGARHWVKLHLKTQQGIKLYNPCRPPLVAVILAAGNY